MCQEKFKIEYPILKMRVGSHLYGTNGEDSDEDFSGVFLPNREYLFGLKNVEHVNCGIVDKDASGKNTINAVDYTMYEFRKFVSLALANNPNIIEMLFVNDSDIIYSNSVGQELLANKHLFPHKGAMKRFIGYARSQRHKMIVKKESIQAFSKAIEYLKELPANMILAELPHNLPYLKRDGKRGWQFKCGDIQLDRSCTVKRALKIFIKRSGEATHRKDNILKYGFDLKFASHLIRLLIEGEELLRTSQISFPILEHKKVLDIKQGKWSLPDILAYADELEIRCEEALNISTLPQTQRFKEFNKFVIDILSNHV